MRIYDAHNHLQDDWLAPYRAQVLADLSHIPVLRAVVNGTCQSDWPEVTALAAEHPWILPSYGLHPWNVGNATATWKDELLGVLDAAPVAAVGEIGLDRWILDRARPDDPRLGGLRRAALEDQLAAFTWQLERAAEHNRPVTIHCLDAWGILHETLRHTPRPARGFLLHAFGGSLELARELVALGAYFSFNGYFLGERQVAKRTVFAALPADRVLVETDAPAMPLPPQHRAYSLPGVADGNPINHPANIIAVYAGLAVVRQLPLETLAAQVAANFEALFGAGSDARP